MSCLAVSWACAVLDDLAQPKLDMVRGQGHALDMALDKVTIVVGQLLAGVACVEVIARALQGRAPRSRVRERGSTDPGDWAFFCSTAWET